MLTSPNGTKYDITFDDDTGMVVLIIPHSDGRKSRLEFDRVRDVLEFLGKRHSLSKTA